MKTAMAVSEAVAQPCERRPGQSRRGVILEYETDLGVELLEGLLRMALRRRHPVPVGHLSADDLVRLRARVRELGARAVLGALKVGGDL